MKYQGNTIVIDKFKKMRICFSLCSILGIFIVLLFLSLQNSLELFQFYLETAYNFDTTPSTVEWVCQVGVLAIGAFSIAQGIAVFKISKTISNISVSYLSIEDDKIVGYGCHASTPTNEPLTHIVIPLNTIKSAYCSGTTDGFNLSIITTGIGYHFLAIYNAQHAAQSINELVARSKVASQATHLRRLCPRCGGGISDTAAYCEKCGTHVATIPKAPPKSITRTLTDKPDWECPNCLRRNPHYASSCKECGAPKS